MRTLAAPSLAVALLVLASISTAGSVPGVPEMKVLFIGNSLTYWNDLPAIVQSLAKAGKQRNIDVQSITFPDYSLEDHWNRGDALREIKKGKWNIVVLQQGPSASPPARASLIRYAALYSAEIRSIGAKTALYSVWPSKTRKADLEESIRSYELAAKDVQAMLIPVGTAWKNAWRLDPNVKLYDVDGLHPSMNGSYLAALVFYETLFARSSSGLPSQLKLSSRTVRSIEIDSSIANILQSAASAAVAENARKKTKTGAGVQD
jgi:hypothetical protein